MIPAIDDTFLYVDTEVELASTDFALDEKKLNGRVSGLDEIKQAIYFILNSERYEYEIYSWNYGFEASDLIGITDYNFIESELTSRIKEALMQDERILDVGAFEFEKNKNSVHVTFTVSTTDGEIESEVDVDV